MALETVQITVVDTQVVPQPIDGVTVRVFDATGTTFITEGITGGVTPGVVEFTLTGTAAPTPTQYSIRTVKTGVSILSPQAIEVYSPASDSSTGTNNFKLVGTVATLPTATNPRLCRASGYIYDAAGRPLPGVDMHFIPQFDPLIVDSLGVLGERVSVRTDKDGWVQIDLWRNGIYQVMVQSQDEVRRDVVVPDQNSALLMNLLFPVVAVVSYVPAGPYSLAVNGELTLTSTVVATDMRTLGNNGIDDVIYETDDPTIASVMYQSDGTLILRGNATGATNLTASRRDLTVVTVPDPGISGTPIVVTVV